MHRRVRTHLEQHAPHSLDLNGQPVEQLRLVATADDEPLHKRAEEATAATHLRWQLLVLEDAEALLHKGTAGRGMATLLNLCDGLLGQGLRCLFLITTNEPLAAVHPALVRAGRCLSQVEFGPLPASQASHLLGRPVSVPMTLAEVMATKPVSSLIEATNVRCSVDEDTRLIFRTRVARRSTAPTTWP